MATPLPLQSYIDLGRFAALRTRAETDQRGALAEVAKEFEALFIQMMLKAARDAAPAESEFDSNEVKFYREMFDNQIALNMAREGRLGFAELLTRQLPAVTAQNTAPIELKLPERRVFGDSQVSFSPMPEPELEDEVVDITTWKARVTDRAFADDARDFAAKLLVHAKRAAARLGTSPEILVAQAALETGWGRHVPARSNGQSSNNLFGIKADPSWMGETVRRRTLEYFDGQPVRVNAAFRSYPDYGAAFDDYADFIETSPRYRRALERAGDP
ncbi:MAG: flagellar assembly peptidoglycan hydrolase FlgJ, partial [Gammaproteobacteria bacterium]